MAEARAESSEEPDTETEDEEEEEDDDDEEEEDDEDGAPGRAGRGAGPEAKMKREPTMRIARNRPISRNNIPFLPLRVCASLCFLVACVFESEKMK